MDSEGPSGRPTSLELTVFEFHAATAKAIDLTRSPLVQALPDWTHPTDYSATQELADQARAVEIDLIRYPSARRPDGMCLAMLSPRVFKHVA